VHYAHVLSFFFLIIPLPPRSTLFPYTTLFRSQVDGNGRGVGGDDGVFTNHIFHFTQNDVFNFRVLNNRFNYQVNGFEVAVAQGRSEEHTSELQSRENLVCRLLLEKKNNMTL